MGFTLYVCSKCNSAITAYERHHIEFSNCDTDLDLCDLCYDELLEDNYIEKNKNKGEENIGEDGYEYTLLHIFSICLILRTQLKFNNDKPNE